MPSALLVQYFIDLPSPERGRISLNGVLAISKQQSVSKNSCLQGTLKAL